MILVLRALGVGDLATAVPALRALRAGYPGEELVLAAPAWLGPLVALVGGIDRLLPTDDLGPPPWPVRSSADPPRWPARSSGGAPPWPVAPPGDSARWPGPPPEVAVNLHGRGPRSHRMLAGAGRLVAFRCPAGGHRDGPDWRDDEHEVDRWCRLLAWHGIAADRTDLALRRPAPGRVPAGVTVVHPGSKVEAKRWPADRFAALARRLADRGHRVVVTGSAGERELAARVAAGAGLPESAVLAGRTDLGELAALVAAARLVVSGDTGVGHLATAYRVPSVLLFGPVPPARWGPPTDRPWHRVLWASGEDCGGSSGVPTASRWAALPVDRVLAAVDEAEETVRV
ncbi:glycosyltransferase family 9 protein [Micromonospora matsumotoense]|uniref:glycosyltransferase family 9 protein n=1 Tax=Micromonospora matsumotoense TaxID=121616 RepID=UPI0033FF9482